MDFAQSFLLAAPEVLFSVAGLILLLVSAWARTDRDARGITWLAVAVLAGAAMMIAPTLWNGADAGTVAFSGLFFCLPAEAAALTALYALLIETVFHRDLKITRDVPRVMTE